MHVAITGASAGIGEALVRAWAARGASVTLVARRKDRLEQIAREVSGKTFVYAADLSLPEGATAFLAPAQEALGPIDVLAAQPAAAQARLPSVQSRTRHG